MSRLDRSIEVWLVEAADYVDGAINKIDPIHERCPELRDIVDRLRVEGDRLYDILDGKIELTWEDKSAPDL